jgi:hypothetical protein
MHVLMLSAASAVTFSERLVMMLVDLFCLLCGCSAAAAWVHTEFSLLQHRFCHLIVVSELYQCSFAVLVNTVGVVLLQ